MGLILIVMFATSEPLQNSEFDLLNAQCIKIKFDFIVCNLPYLATDEILDIATDGGAEGLEIPKIFDSAKTI